MQTEVCSQRSRWCCQSKCPVQLCWDWLCGYQNVGLNPGKGKGRRRDGGPFYLDIHPMRKLLPSKIIVSLIIG